MAASNEAPPNIKFKPRLEVQQLKALSLFTVANFLSVPECEAFIRYAEGLGFAHQGSLGPAKGEAFRDNDRISVQDATLADKLWRSGLSALFVDVKIDGRTAVRLNPNIRFYRYKEGQRFGPHIDESIDLGGGQTTEYTVLVYLNGSGNISTRKSKGKSNNDIGWLLQGGETVFYTGRKAPIEVLPVAGTALLHIHGDKCLLHEARIVSRGIKYVLRSDVVFA